MNQKDLRIKKLYERGMRDKSRIARAIGFGGAMEQGVRRVEEGFNRLGIMESPENKMMDESPERKTVFKGRAVGMSVPTVDSEGWDGGCGGGCEHCRMHGV